MSDVEEMAATSEPLVDNGSEEDTHIMSHLLDEEYLDFNEDESEAVEGTSETRHEPCSEKLDADGRVSENNTDPANHDEISEEDKIKESHYSHSKRDEFSSENFKIELGGLPKYYSLGQLRKLLNLTLQLDAHRVKPGGSGRNLAYVNFKDEASRTKAKLILNGYKIQLSTLTAKDADPAKDPMLLSKIEHIRLPKREDEDLPLLDRIMKAVTPIHHKSYEDQIKEKDRTVKQMMRKFGNELAQMNPELKNFVHWHKIRRKGQICEMDDFVESPMREGYRNKCEFTIGKNNETEDPVIGFRVASYKEGSIEVGPINHLRHLNDQMKTVVKSMEEFLKTSQHKPFDPFSHSGVWRQLTVRTSNNNDVMIIVIVHPQELTEEELKGLKEDIVSYFTTGGGTSSGVTSIFFQQHSHRKSGKEMEYEHLWGKEYIEETILGKTFRASPDAFLQVNTAACEVMYTKIAEILEVDMTTVVLDVCCGVGTIGLSLAENAHKVFGVESTSKAIEDAKFNCESNQISNAVFYNGKAEDYIDTMIERCERVNTVAIVDPPRAGLNGSVMNALRKCEHLDKLVYISCDPQAALPNFQALGRPRSKTYKGTYFVPIRASAIDMFPDTNHFELVILFERYDECKWDRIMAGNPRPKDQAYFDRLPVLDEVQEKAKKAREERTRVEKRERREKEKERDREKYRHREKDRDRNRDVRSRLGIGSGGGGGAGWRGGDERGGGSSGRSSGGGRWRSDGGSSRSESGRSRRHSDRSPPKKPQQYGIGFQEGFQAGLEALKSGQFLGFGQGGGWKMATQTPSAGYDSTKMAAPIPPTGYDNTQQNQPEFSSVNSTTGMGNWETLSGSAGGTGVDNFSNQGGAQTYHPPYKGGQMGGYETTNNFNMGTGMFDYSSQSDWNQSGGSRTTSNEWQIQTTGRGSTSARTTQGGSSWGQQYQTFDEPGNKKWKGDTYESYGYDGF